MTIAASAPGKLFLLGEYAVLEGAPAVLAAVDRRVRVALAPGAQGHWQLQAPDIGVPNLPLRSDGSLPADLDAATAARLDVYAAARAVAPAALPAMQIRIDTAAFAQDGAKLGLGASAAVTAALTAAFARATDATLTPAALCARAMASHRAAQGGAGSGADVATAVHGGLRAFKRDGAPVALAWPRDLHAQAVITGRGANTRTLLQQVAALHARDAACHKLHLGALSELAGSGHAALARGDTGGFLAAAQAYTPALAALGAAAGADIVTDVHERLHAAVAAAGGVFKPTGAGGGDLGLIFAGSSATHAAALDAARRCGCQTLALTFNAPGLHTQGALK